MHVRWLRRPANPGAYPRKTRYRIFSRMTASTRRPTPSCSRASKSPTSGQPQKGSIRTSSVAQSIPIRGGFSVGRRGIFRSRSYWSRTPSTTNAISSRQHYRTLFDSPCSIPQLPNPLSPVFASLWAQNGDTRDHRFVGPPSRAVAST